MGRAGTSGAAFLLAPAFAALTRRALSPTVRTTLEGNMKLSKNTGRRGTIILSALLAAALLAVLQQKAEAKISSTGAAILGGVAGLAVGAAIADSRKPRTKIYYEGYAPPPHYDPYFNQAFSPTAGIVCYPAQRLCYNNGGSISGKWTRNVYGY